MKIRKKGQFWYMDFMVAIIVMAVIGVLFIKTVIGMSQTKNLMDDLLIEAQEISENLVSSRILTDGNHRINPGSSFLTKTYPEMKKALGTNKEFYAYVNDGTSIINVFPGSKGIGKFKGTDSGWTTVQNVRDPVNELIREKRIENIIEINRLIGVNEGSADNPRIKIHRLTILVWSEKG